MLAKSKEEKQKRLKECEDEIAKVEAQLPDSKELQKKLKSEIERATNSMESKKAEIEQTLNKCLQHLNSLKAHLTRLDSTVIDEGAQKSLAEKLKKLGERRSELERRRVQLETDKTSVSNKEQKVQTLRSQWNKKILQDDIATLNGELMDLQEEVEALSGVEKEVRIQFVSFCNCTIYFQTRQYERSYEICNNKIQALKGQLGPLKESILKAKKQLLEPNIKNAVHNFQDKHGDRCVMEDLTAVSLFIHPSNDSNVFLGSRSLC